ncbi:fatty acid desaturase [Leptolyngbya cf. ectocarpi LEGE 11479]|uniref:Fatty acid desaturase n=1 Tax=Leptolyngbya cf. ectocarpi LEGE 11479 TaxID=1828722 RepID=A0A928ZSY0_LEPEC|nr:fatty acid desaturase [Leptolyngbya ectocarpi]MBE9065996.1 fatty acid desaturase [Leptolyngbya cf. ectocarpi LEGE 11479]
MAASKCPTVSNKVLQEAVADLQAVNGWTGFWRFTILGVATLGCMALAWTASSEWLFWGGTLVAGVFYALWLICTHDASHHTLWGWPLAEEILARVISWPMLWPVGVYSELHCLHHGWNGLDVRDPERYQRTTQEFQQSSAWGQWYIRHQWVVNIFILGGFGIIAKTLRSGLQFQGQLPRLRRQLWIDGWGIGLVQTGLLTAVVLSRTSVLRYLLFWLCLERVVGAIAQTRAHLEHYGLWHPVGGHQLTQLYASRNVQTSAWLGWLIGGLNYHAVHHAFPGIPFDQLPEAHKRIQSVLTEHGLPVMEMEHGYFRALQRWSNGMTLIPREQ